MLIETFDATGRSLSSLYQSDVAILDGGRVELTGTYLPAHSKTFSYHTGGPDRSKIEISSKTPVER